MLKWAPMAARDLPRRASSLLLAAAVLAAAGCADLFRQRTVTTEVRRPPAEAPAPASAPAPPTAGAPSPAGTPPAGAPRPTVTAEATLAEQLTRLAGELTELQNAVARLVASVQQHEGQLQYLDRRLRELEDGRARGAGVPRGFAPAAPGPPPGTIPSATTTTAEDLYRLGVEKLRAKQLDAAVLVFYDLIVTYPEHPLRERAQLAVADIFYAQKDWRGALAEFEGLLAAVPNSARVPDALVKIGLCQRELGNGALARRAWERVLRDHPQSVAARQARILLKQGPPKP